MGRSQKLYTDAKKIIPGGVQLLSKRPEMFLPELWPAYYSKAQGCEVWDLDGKKYIDASYMALGACILGYSVKAVDDKVREAIRNGNITTLNCPEEVALAKRLLKIHPWAQMVRYARSGGEAMSIAVRIARAATGKDLILFCGYHGWHDWYLAANLNTQKALDGHLLPGLQPAGVPRALRGTALPLSYNNTKEFLALMAKYKKRIAAVVMEPIRNFYPQKGFLETIRRETAREKIVFIFDEVSSGWRLNLGGAHLVLGVNPDICVFAKAMSNGYPMAAIIGRKNVMAAAQKTFISSTYWTDRIGPTAALATIDQLEQRKVAKHLNAIGRKVQQGWKRSAARHGLPIKISGIYPMGHFSFHVEEPMVLKTLFTQEMLAKGFLATSAFYASFAHKEKHINAYLKAVDKVFGHMAKAMKSGNPKRFLKDRVCQSGFKRLT